jgi:phosphopantothenoylcysteine synthetase/decarboxylase
LSKEAKNHGARVSLLLGPVDDCCLDKSIRILHFKFFDELRKKLIEELSTKRYDAVIHSAAVSDYRPKKIFKNKINSDLRKFNLKLVPTPKLVDLIKKIDGSVLAVAFKFEPHIKVNPAPRSKRRDFTRCGVNRLISRAKTLLRRCEMDLVVANSIVNGRYRAYILSKDKITGPIPSKNNLAKELIKNIGELFERD